MKRILRNTTHVTRGYGRNNSYGKTKNIRLKGENYKVEIRKFDRNFDFTYTLNSISSNNLKRAKWRNVSCLYFDEERNQDNEPTFLYWDNIPTIEFEYTCSETGNYMIELLYFSMNYTDTTDNQTDYIDKDCSSIIRIKIDNDDFMDIDDYNKEINNNVDNLPRCQWTGDENNINRHTQLVTLFEGKTYTFQYETNMNTAIVGAIIKKYDIYYGTRTNDGDLTIDDINIKINDKIQPNEATVKIWYSHDLDDDSNISGYLFDYRDEINIYKKDENDTDLKQIFGGYIITVDVESDNTLMTLNCADRLIDGENRFCFQEMVILGGESDEKGQTYNKDSFHDYNSRGDMLEYLTGIFEVPLLNNNVLNNSYFQREFGHQYWYTRKLSPRFVANNMTTDLRDDYLIIRNGVQVDTNSNSYDNKGNNPQSLTILDTTTTGENIILNNNPNLWLQYGLGEPEYTKEVKHTIIETTTNGVHTYLNIDDISDTVRKFADSVTDKKDYDCVKPLWKAVAKFTHQKASGFNRTPEQVIKYKSGNCCSKSRLLAECLAYKEITGIYYVHIKKDNALGHVFLKLARYGKKSNFYVDPSYSNEKEGWGNYGHYNGASVTKNLKKETLFPKRPL